MSIVCIKIDHKGIFVGANWQPINELKYPGTYLLKRYGNDENKLLLINIESCRLLKHEICPTCEITIIGIRENRILLESILIFDEFLDLTSDISKENELPLEKEKPRQNQ